MVDKSESPQLVTSPSRGIQLTYHRRQLSADSASSQQSSLLLLNIDDVELNRFTRHVTTSPSMSVNDVETGDVNVLEPLVEHPQQIDDTLLQNAPITATAAAAAAAAAGAGSVLEDEDRDSAPDEPLLSNAFSNTQCKYTELVTVVLTVHLWNNVFQNLSLVALLHILFHLDFTTFVTVCLNCDATSHKMVASLLIYDVSSSAVIFDITVCLCCLFHMLPLRICFNLCYKIYCYCESYLANICTVLLLLLLFFCPLVLHFQGHRN